MESSLSTHLSLKVRGKFNQFISAVSTYIGIPITISSIKEYKEERTMSLKRMTVTNWEGLTSFLLQNRGKKIRLTQMYGKRGKDSNDQADQIARVDSVTLEAED